MNKLTLRTWTFIFAGIGLLALVLLAVSLNGLHLAPGQPVSFQELAPKVSDPGTANDWMSSLVAVLRVAMIALWILLPILLIFILINKEARKRFLRDMLMILPILVLLYFMSNQKLTQKAVQDLNPSALGQPTLENMQLTAAPPPPEFVPPPAWVTTLTTVLIALAVTLVIVGVVYAIWRRAQNQRNLQEPLKKVGREAQAALDAIYAGGDLRETIMRCYLQMVEALKEYRGIYRNYDMTPHEFELLLQKRGLPGEPIHQLTQLFEQVRYGAINPGRQDEVVAITSLSAIVSACQKPRSA